MKEKVQITMKSQQKKLVKYDKGLFDILDSASGVLDVKEYNVNATSDVHALSSIIYLKFKRKK